MKTNNNKHTQTKAKRLKRRDTLRYRTATTKSTNSLKKLTKIVNNFDKEELRVAFKAPKTIGDLFIF